MDLVLNGIKDGFRVGYTAKTVQSSNSNHM